MRIRLDHRDLSLELDPAAGGSVSSFKHNDLEILRSAPSRIGPAFDPRNYSAFPMVPYVGRIHNGRCHVSGNQIQLHPNLPPEPHSIHGFGWQTAWKIENQTQTSARLVHVHDADAWPWTYTTSQTFQLEDESLVLDMELTNQGPDAMPAGLGWHPYFYRKDATLKLPTTHEWQPNEETGENLPVPIEPEADLTPGRRVEDLKLDTAFRVAEPVIRMSWPTHAVTMVSDPVFANATIYVPPGEDYFCAEPITHAPNAVNGALADDVTGQRWLAPGETLRGTIRLTVAR
ncbi:MAG: aldose 1-epimerase [Henriciella sp.]